MTNHTYGETLSDFKVGQRVELHPGTDLWMMGARMGTVIWVGRKYVHVKLDRITPVKFATPDLLRIVE